MGMTLDEARELLKSPLWNRVRDHFLDSGEFVVYPAGDLRRLEYLDEETRCRISHWCDATARMESWKKVIAGSEVREIGEKFGDVYPDIFRYEAYFAKCNSDQERLRMVLKLKFPDALELVERG